MELAEALERLQCAFGIGLATGSVFVGPVGSKQRKEHAVVGDTVNSAARLSGKAYQFIEAEQKEAAAAAAAASAASAAAAVTAASTSALHRRTPSVAVTSSPGHKRSVSVLNGTSAAALNPSLKRNRLILFDENTHKQLSARATKIRCVARGEIKVKGKQQMIKIYSPLPASSNSLAEQLMTLSPIIGLLLADS
jgi:class 3 adenylate cyclase